MMSEEQIDIESAKLFGDLTIPEKAKGLVIFAHGSGSSRKSPRNQLVAKELNQAGLGTFLFDLLSLEEEKVDEATAELRFDIPFLAKRLISVTNWVEERHRLPIGYFGASTGAAAALVAASEKDVKAVVSRGGRPDLAAQSLPKVKAPTLLIVGGLDTEVIKMNESALSLLNCTKQLEIVEGASHLFEESGKLELVAKLAASWFSKYIR